MELSVRFFFFVHLAHQTWQAWMKWWSKNDQVARFHAYIFAFIIFGVNAARDGKSYRGRSQRLWTMKKDLCQTFPLKCYWTMVFCCSTYPPPLVSGPLWKSYMIKLWSWFSVSIVFFLLSNYNKNNDVMLSTLEPISDGDSSVPRCVAQTREQLQPYIISLLQHYCQYLCNIGTDSAAFWFWSELLEHCGQYLCNILIYCGTLWSTFLP